MKRLLIAAALASVVLLVRSDSPASAVLSDDFRWLQSSTSGRGSMLDFSAKMVCPLGGYNSIIYAATQWDATVFGQNTPIAYVPFYTWNGTSCNQLMDNSVPVFWGNKNLPCSSYPSNCTFGVVYNFGIWDDPPPGGGTYGLCWDNGQFCTISDRAEVYISTNSSAQMTSSNPLTRQIAIHELGHPVGLGDVSTWPCDLNYRSIMYYDCLFNHGQVNPGPLDQVEIWSLY